MIHPLDIRRIMCLTSMDEQDEGTVRYAASLAGDMNAELVLFHVNVVPVHAGPWGTNDEKLAQSDSVTKELSRVAKRIEKEYGVDCDLKVKEGKQLTNTTIEKGDDEGFDLVVMGTSGDRNVSELLFGSNTYHVIEVTEKPVLVVPHGTEYTGVERLIYATDEEEAELTSLIHLRAFIDDLSPQVSIVHDLELLEPRSEDAHFFRKKVEFILGKPDLEFIELKQGNVAEGIERKAREMKADIVALSSKARKFPGGLFHRSVTEDLRRIADHPFLVLHKGLELEEAPRFLDVILDRDRTSSETFPLFSKDREITIVEKVTRGVEEVDCELVMGNEKGSGDEMDRTDPITTIERNGFTYFHVKLADPEKVQWNASVRFLLAVH